ncbi:MAG: DNA mismatch repair protein MutS [Lentisphaerae bacterium]|nr:DNA mismatch repair protein MutS [Lentisphaerota bacterium]
MIYKMAENSKLTPMMIQYREAKAQIPPDAVLLFRLGDFYEEFFEDAETVSHALDLTLTKRQGTPMCGFPYHALDSYLPRLVAAGLKVAIAEQVEDPKLVTKGIVKRQITRIITPGTMIDNALLHDDGNNFLGAVAMDKSESLYLAALDVSTGEFYVCETGSAEKLASEIRRMGVREILATGKLKTFLLESGEFPTDEKAPLWSELDDYCFDKRDGFEFLCRHFHSSTLDGFGLRGKDAAVGAAAAVLRYAAENLRHEAAHVTLLQFRTLSDTLELDPITLRNLEITGSLFENSRRGSLLGVLDKSVTPMGGRKLRSFLVRPLRDHDAIVRRLDAVENFVIDPMALAEFRESLRVVKDLERIVGRLNVGIATPRDLQNLGSSLESLPAIKVLLESLYARLFTECTANIGNFGELTTALMSALADELPASISDGGVIRSGYSAELDELRSAASDGKSWLSSIQQREIERTGIKSLKVKFNNVFGYYIEVSKSNLSLVPEDYIRKQTLVNAERFITPELKELENRILGAEEKARALEQKIFDDLRRQATACTADIQRSAEALAELDAIAGFAETARIHNYCRPAIFDDDRLDIRDGRHPVLDDSMESGTFVPNDTILDGDERRMMVITGPNMAGKSTYIRQTALLVIMAQAGSFVPARSMEIGMVDRIFTRIGAADDLSRGQSTFMVEMVETANILRHATEKSLVILDEVGRGTSTFDGLSLAWSIAEYLHDQARSRTMFATHYHELTELAQTRRGVNNFNVAVREYGDEVIFLRQIIPGAADRSYGIHVARLAGVPEAVLERAKSILELLEKNAAAPREAMAAIPRRPVRNRRRADDENDSDILQLRLL